MIACYIFDFLILLPFHFVTFHFSKNTEVKYIRIYRNFHENESHLSIFIIIFQAHEFNCITFCEFPFFFFRFSIEIFKILPLVFEKFYIFLHTLNRLFGTFLFDLENCARWKFAYRHNSLSGGVIISLSHPTIYVLMCMYAINTVLQSSKYLLV
jgi:hypothetical protein